MKGREYQPTYEYQKFLKEKNKEKTGKGEIIKEINIKTPQIREHKCTV